MKNGPVVRTVNTDDILKSTRDMLTNAKKVMKSLSKCVREGEENLEICETNRAFDTDARSKDYITHMAKDIHDKTTHSLRSNAMLLYESSSLLLDLPSEHGDLCDQPTMRFNTSLTELGVEVHIEDDGIYAKTPLLWSKNELTDNDDRFFRDEISYTIISSDAFKKRDFSEYENKVVFFLHVLSKSTVGLGQARDNDNYHTKRIQDALTGFLPHGDSPYSTAIFISSIATDEIPEGTYTTITPRSKSDFDELRVIARWKMFLKSKDA